MHSFRHRLDFFLNANFSGTKYLSYKHATITGRIFWFIVLTMSFFGMFTIFKLTIRRYYTDMTTIDIDTLFLNWESTFPAVSLCLSKGRTTSQKLKEFLRHHNIPYNTSEVKFARVIHYYMFMTNNRMNFQWQEDCLGLNDSCGVNIDILKNKVYFFMRGWPHNIIYFFREYFFYLKKYKFSLKYIFFKKINEIYFSDHKKYIEIY